MPICSKDVAHEALYSSTAQDSGAGCGFWVEDITLGFSSSCTLWTQTLVVGGRRLRLISRTAPSSLITRSQRQPEVKGKWMDEQHLGGKELRMERRGNKLCLYFLGWNKGWFLSGLLHNWVGIILARRGEKQIFVPLDSISHEIWGLSGCIRSLATE